ncbi:DUF1080 domain-containing protein [Pirellulales bacterium]|nr:DUF1080 domain-containing protein [Pirellulales bacterium]
MRHIRNHLAWFAAAIVSLGSVAFADDRSVSLLHSSSLAGWGYASTRGWSNENGVLSGDEESARLLSGFSVGDFTLELSIRGPNRALVRLLLHPMNGGEVVEVPIRVEAGPGEMTRHFEVSRNGSRLVLSSGTELTVPERDRFAIGLSIVEGQAELHEIRLVEPEGNPIFNGDDLTGWRDLSGADKWRTRESGVLFKPYDKSTTTAGYLRTEGTYENFTLRLEYRIQNGGNSGIAIRTPDQGWPSSDGFELQILDRAASPDKENMAIYGNVGPLSLAHRSDEWNRVVVKADGRLISAWVNGQLVQHVNTSTHPELRHRPLQGWIGLQDHLDEVEFCRIHVLEAPGGPGRPEWNNQEVIPGYHLLDQLMNPELLARDEGRETKAVTREIADASRTLLDVAGPGALLQVVASDANGRLRFYRDGAAEPLLTSNPSELAEALPGVELAEDQAVGSLLTYLPFNNRLRITTDRDEPSVARLTYATWPAAEGPAFLSEDRSDFMRRWRPALEYRLFQHRFNRIPHQQFYPQVRGLVDRIAASDRAVLAEIEGKGTVQWLRLECDPEVLQSNDLWLEISVDGEPTPAVACPARMWFAPLVGGVEHRSFVTTHCDGFVTRIAVPFGKRFSAILHNRGAQAVDNNSITAGYKLNTDSQAEPDSQSWRLQGLVVNLSEQPATAEIAGRGRLFGIVFDSAREGTHLIDALVVDHQTRDDWSAMSKGRFLGTGDSTKPKQYHVLSGCDHDLTWRYMTLAPLDYRDSLLVEFPQLSDSRALLLVYKQVD